MSSDVIRRYPVILSKKVVDLVFSCTKIIMDMLHYGFIQKALISGTLIAVSCSILGVFLVLRRLSLVGDGLAHISFGGVALGLFFNLYPLYIAVPFVMIASLGIIKLTEKANIFGDAAIGIVSSVALAAGIILVNVAGGFNIDLFSYLFGNILAISDFEVILAVFLSVIVILALSSFYKQFFSITFDEDMAQVSGINTKSLNKILILLTSLTVVLAMKVVGIILVSAFIILPAATALQISQSFKSTILLSMIFAVSSVISGIFISFIINLPTGATIVMTNFIFFAVSIVIPKKRF